ncbi:MAG: 16S rRNA (guanine(966)-N(2))-methyltransferase RsmD [Gammaproteobacteria bacterium]
MVRSDGKSRELRIIAGLWRGRRFRFPDGTDIRPTPDRVRETLFNWLAPVIRGARVLDVFAGSGALGLEALSRGATFAEFIDSDAHAVDALRERLAEWKAEPSSYVVKRTDAMQALAGTRPATQPAFDVVFIDPPFAAGLWRSVADRLEAGRWLAPEAYLYLEAPARDPLDTLPSHWGAWRHGTAGEVGYHLLRRAEPAA